MPLDRVDLVRHHVVKTVNLLRGERRKLRGRVTAEVDEFNPVDIPFAAPIGPLGLHDTFLGVEFDALVGT